MEGFTLAMLGMALVIVLGGIGSAIGVSLSGQMASGVITEEPRKFGKMIPLVGIAGTQGFYSLLIGFLVMMKLKLLTGEPLTNISMLTGAQLLFICAPIGFVEMFSAIYQGKAAAAAIGIVAKREEEAGKALILPAFVEVYAVLGLVAAFLLLNAVKV